MAIAGDKPIVRSPTVIDDSGGTLNPRELLRTFWINARKNAGNDTR
jgi:hypothetical protein